MTLIFAKAFVLGFLMAAPLGPAGIFCIQRTFKKGWLAGIVSGLGAATVDGFYGALAALGTGLVFTFLAAHQLAFRLISGLFLFLLGILTFFEAPTRKTYGEMGGNISLTRDYIATAFLTLVNPATVLYFAALFAVVGFNVTADELLYTPTVAFGVAAGSMVWWIFLTSIIGYIKTKTENIPIRTIERITGVVTLIVAAVLLTNLIGK